MYKLSVIVIFCLFATVGKSQDTPTQEPIKVVEAFLSKVEKSKTIRHSTEQMWSRHDQYGIDNQDIPINGQCKFMIVPEDTIGAYYSFSSEHDVTRERKVDFNYNGISLSTVYHKDSSIRVTDIQQFPSQKIYITSPMMYRHSVIDLYNLIKASEQLSYSNLSFVADTIINNEQCIRAVIKGGGRSYGGIISISSSTSLPLHSIIINYTSIGNQVFESSLSDFKFDEQFEKEIFSANNVPDGFRRIDYSPVRYVPTLMPGNEAPKFQLATVQGDPVSLASYQGKVVLLQFSGANCGFCGAEIPSLNELYKKFDKKQFELLSVYSDASNEKLKGYIEKLEIEYPILVNGEEEQEKQGLWKKYGVDGIPHFFIIDQEGKISDYWRGYQKGTVETITEEIGKMLTAE